MAKSVKRTNVADTSIECFRQITREGLIRREKVLVLELMKRLNKPVTSRELTTITNIERTSIIRTIYNLCNENKIMISHKDHCPVTLRTVSFYKVNTEDHANE